MGRAGHSLKQILDRYAITQYRLAATIGIERTNIYRWVHEQRDPTAENVVEIVRALYQLNPDAAIAFVEAYLGEVARGG